MNSEKIAPESSLERTTRLVEMRRWERLVSPLLASRLFEQAAFSGVCYGHLPYHRLARPPPTKRHRDSSGK